MRQRILHGFLRGMVLIGTLTCAPLTAFPQVKSHAQAVAGLTQPAPEARAEALAWLAAHGSMADQPRLLARLRDEDADVRAVAEQALWLLWSRSGDAAVDALLAQGTEAMQEGRLAESIGLFSEVIRRRPGFAEGWNKRATAYFLAGDLRHSLADCDQVMKRNRSHFGALSGYGQIYLQLEQYEKAAAYWRRALEVNPNMDGVVSSLEQLEQLLKAKRGRTI